MHKGSPVETTPQFMFPPSHRTLDHVKLTETNQYTWLSSSRESSCHMGSDTLMCLGKHFLMAKMSDAYTSSKYFVCTL